MDAKNQKHRLVLGPISVNVWVVGLEQVEKSEHLKISSYSLSMRVIFGRSARVLKFLSSNRARLNQPSSVASVTLLLNSVYVQPTADFSCTFRTFFYFD